MKYTAITIILNFWSWQTGTILLHSENFNLALAISTFLAQLDIKFNTNN